ncbi:MAG: hypothetical protein O2857_13300 [Planctomycetota bacterium]|nr:hypothetical protein [Planctomycetota bacterium]
MAENPKSDRLNLRRKTVPPARRKGTGAQLLLLVALLIMTFWTMRNLNSPAGRRVFQMFFGTNQPVSEELPQKSEEGEDLTPVRIHRD